MVVSAGAASCVLGDLDLEGRPCPCAAGYFCDEAANVCRSSPTTGTTSSGASHGGGQGGDNGGGEGGGGAGSGGSSEGGGGGGREPVLAVPLTVEGGVATGEIALSVAGSFRIESDVTNHWQLVRWFDLAADPDTDLAGKSPGVDVDLLLDTVQIEDAEHGWTASSDGTLAVVSGIDQTPARYGLSMSIDYPLTGLSVSGTYWIYANGRVSVVARMASTSPVEPVQVVDSKYHYVSVNPSVEWSTSSVDEEHSAVFVRTDGASPGSMLQVINASAESPALGDYPDENRYWRYGSVSLPPWGAVERYGALLLGPRGLDAATLAQRSSDLRSPDIQIGEGATVEGDGFDERAATYVVTATGPLVELGVTAGRPRFSPSFVIRDWFEESWSIRLGEQVLVADDMLTGYGAVAFHDVAAGELVFVYLGDIAEGTPDAGRIFTLEAQ